MYFAAESDPSGRDQELTKQQMSHLLRQIFMAVYNSTQDNAPYTGSSHISIFTVTTAGKSRICALHMSALMLIVNSQHIV